MFTKPNKPQKMTIKADIFIRVEVPTYPTMTLSHQEATELFELLREKLKLEGVPPSPLTSSTWFSSNYPLFTLSKDIHKKI